MAQRGRKPKPTAVKVLEGNPGKRSLIRPNRSLKRKHHAVRHGLRMKRKRMEEDEQAAGAVGDSHGD